MIDGADFLRASVGDGVVFAMEAERDECKTWGRDNESIKFNTFEGIQLLWGVLLDEWWSNFLLKLNFIIVKDKDVMTRDAFLK